MKIVHTSDWHLGHKLLYNDRESEHTLALDWLAAFLKDNQVEGLIIAGDIFDIGNPPNYARKLYYRFLAKMLDSPCRHILVIGGNHDSPTMLEAPRDILDALNINVIGAATGNLQDEIVEWRDTAGNLELIIAAIPFLRDRDLRTSEAGESGFDRIAAISDRITDHYQQMGALVEASYPFHYIPVIATGHLYASGAKASEPQNNIYIGNVENISADNIPEVFDYVALGHIHRPQPIGDREEIRYSGSLIPLSFSETQDEKSITLVTFEGKTPQIKIVPVPTFRRLKTIQGTLEEVKEGLQRFQTKERENLTPWVELIVETDKLIPQLDAYFQDYVKEMPLEILKIRVVRQQNTSQNQSSGFLPEDISDMDVLEVFEKKCASLGSLPDDIDELRATFRELQSWMQDREE